MAALDEGSGEERLANWMEHLVVLPHGPVRVFIVQLATVGVESPAILCGQRNTRSPRCAGRQHRQAILTQLTSQERQITS